MMILIILLLFLDYKKHTSLGFVIQTTTKRTNNKCYSSLAFKATSTKQINPLLYSSTTADQTSNINTNNSKIVNDKIVSSIKESKEEGIKWVDDFELSNEQKVVTPEATFYALFSAIRKSAILGLTGSPFYLESNEIVQAMGGSEEESALKGYFTFEDLKQALTDDFLDASYGSTNNAKGWKAKPVSIPTGTSFDEARMKLTEVEAALQKGTVIFNTAGSHIPKLASSVLACTDASSLPCALNMYVTKYGKKTSAPPHTDKQDVIIVQMQGRKHWKVYSPPDPSLKPNSDMYARGKNNDDLPIHSLNDLGCELLLDVILQPGDVLFIPAPFPHTTDTTVDDSSDDDISEEDKTSIHLTFNFDTHVWDLNYLSIRRLALRRAGVKDTALGQDDNPLEDNPYVGNINLLPTDKLHDILSSLPLDFLDDTKTIEETNRIKLDIINESKRISKNLDEETYALIQPETVWDDVVNELHSYGTDLFNIHREMYLAAIDEGKEREQSDGGPIVMTQERMQRLSCFRVPRYFEQISGCKQSLYDWSMEGSAPKDEATTNAQSLPDNWEFTLPVKVGDEIEADLGGAFFPAKVTAVIGSKYNVKYFDGDVMNGLTRDQIKLVNPPDASSDEEPPPGLTKKELKRWRKKQEKKNRK